MDDQTSIQHLKDEIQQFCEERDWDQFHDAKELAIAISTEANELLTHFRFKNKEDLDHFFTDEEKREKVTDEMIDVLFPLLRLAQLYNVDMATEFKRKMNKNREKYPIEKAKGQNKKYTEL